MPVMWEDSLKPTGNKSVNLSDLIQINKLAARLLPVLTSLPLTKKQLSIVCHLLQKIYFLTFPTKLELQHSHIVSPFRWREFLIPLSLAGIKCRLSARFQGQTKQNIDTSKFMELHLRNWQLPSTTIWPDNTISCGLNWFPPHRSSPPIKSLLSFQLSPLMAPQCLMTI